MRSLVNTHTLEYTRGFTNVDVDVEADAVGTPQPTQRVGIDVSQYFENELTSDRLDAQETTTPEFRPIIRATRSVVSSQTVLVV